MAADFADERRLKNPRNLRSSADNSVSGRRGSSALPKRDISVLAVMLTLLSMDDITLPSVHPQLPSSPIRQIMKTNPCRQIGSSAGIVALLFLSLVPVRGVLPIKAAAAKNFSSGANPVTVVLGDLDGDGKLDIVTANDATDDLTILLGDGKGNFTVKTNYSIGTVPQGLAMGDFNGDGIPDLVASRTYGNATIFLRGLGDGNFAPATYQNINASAAIGQVVVGDFNNDGRLDFVAELFPVGLSASMGAGDGTFSNAAPNFLSSDKSIATADFNKDGKLDIAIPYSSGKRVSILLGNGNGTFGNATNFSVPSGPATYLMCIATADLNNDGNPDLVTADQSATNGLTILLGNGNGQFTVKTNYALGSEVTCVAIADLNRDGIPDIAAGVPGNAVCALPGNGDGTFGPTNRFATAETVDGIAIGDVNKDGQMDIVTGNTYGTVSVLLNQSVPSVGMILTATKLTLFWVYNPPIFSLQTSTNLGQGGNWSTVTYNMTTNGSLVTFTDSLNHAGNYYRLRYSP